eukprot:CAMPEP_0113882194 /NCGR_PEP_ID=MMETSP0780_2-20120614/8805_1 /TAXON_ID=652834 /ORGANISM="Palpitomonas bilix" /LENGTH=273 /DNA_ID=CAMNT_0000869153 /DNA_START=192 /DNA_END=1013 /DNA_ORIENTATION=+ /assembly_acc=CAM_ASM_000599
MVKQRDRPSYQVGLLCAEDLRAPFFILRALYLEIAYIKDSVADANLASMKMMWWKESISNTIKNPDSALQQPSLRALAELVKSKSFRGRWIERMAEARLDDVQGNRFKSQQEMVDFCETMHASPLNALADMEGVTDKETFKTLAYLGKSIGMATLLRGTPFDVQKREIHLPVYELAEKGMTQEDFFRMEKTDKLTEIVFDCANFAWGNLEEARDRMSTVPKKLRGPCLQTVAAEDYLKRLEKFSFDVFEPSLIHPRPLPVQLRILRHHLLGTY